MFFYIGNTNEHICLPQVSTGLYLDAGWKNHNDVWYKGYSTECVLSEKLDEITNGYQPRGKWCVIKNGSIFYPLLRGFHLFKKENNLTNLPLPGYDYITHFEDTPDVVDNASLDDVATSIGDILLENVSGFIKYTDVNDLRVLFTSGLDSMTVWSLIDHCTKDYTLQIYLPKPTDVGLVEELGRRREYNNEFTELISSKYWGYNILSLYHELNWYATGYYAEEIQFRDGDAINALANYQNKKLHTIAQPNDYLYWFLLRPSNINKYKDVNQHFENDADLKKFLYSTTFNDYQMWHIDNNMMFSPFFDIRIPTAMMQLSIDDITKNALNGLIQRKIIERFNPQLLSLLSDYKNSKHTWRNFRENWPNIKLDPQIRIIIE